ncbi:hypothetical protein [Rahnella aceris]|uniref:hypothetical protein n=1 Tax=Rahnella sp. (strain Y9602) TaxID=2703885 RepID=UPI001F2C43D0|nr:hypothetical protein [Rahnella aceris]
MKNKSIDALLRGRTLLLEITSDNETYRAWIELSLQDKLKPSYPFRTDSYAMLGHSPYSGYCDLDSAAFKLRKSSFLASDIENEFDPSYDGVENYIEINTLDELNKYLDDNNLSLDDFVDSSDVDDYPL